ncbi:MAG: group 1 truncated hemoglobin [Parafilimonas sp.]|nr:group 1 truncated hemoglobin [Parafilimonas sp.]
MKRTAFMFLLAASFFVIIASSCDKNNNSNPTTLTLYDSLGGTAKVADPANPGQMIEAGRLGIRSVVDSTIFVIAGDDSINHYFDVLLSEVAVNDLSGFQELSKNLTDFFCVATGAKNFTYTGLSMTDAHNPATNPRINEKVNAADFGQFINDLGTGAQQNGLPDYLISRVAAVAETVEGQVVQR